MSAIEIKNRVQEIKDSVSAAVWKEALSLLADAKPKRVLTDEHKAKMQAGRLAKKAAKATEAEVTETTVAKPKKVKTEAAAPSEKPKRVLTDEHKAKMQAGRLAKKAAKAAAEVPEIPKVPEVAEVAKPKRVLTDEQKAKMQAGRVAKKAAKAAVAEVPEVAEVVKPKRVLTAEHKAKMQAGRLAKKAAKAAEAEVPEVEVEAKDAMVEIAGARYLRLADGRCYSVCSEDGEISQWAGMFKNGVLDTTVEEP